ncbi:MAG: hypothetical protein DRG39_02275 [Deltaproteobacteria bacterium]|nr:MAG: hypothetical protein DRG39_02275 [Deltaproteobacteria bacterium]
MLKKKGFICMMALFLLLLGSAQVKAEFKVYDANGQYLGILVTLNGPGKPVIFVPSLKAIFRVVIPDWTSNKDTGIVPGYLSVVYIVYKNNTCSGSAYVDAGEFAFPYLVELSNDLFLIDPDKVETIQSNLLFTKTSSWENGHEVEKCVSLKSVMPDIDDFINIVPLTPLSEDQLPFKLPIKLPLRLEYVPGGFDISGDSKIGLEEAIYSLQVAAGLRANPNTK